MSSYNSAYIVVLDADVRADEQKAEALLNALRMIKGVVEVEPFTADLPAERIGEVRRDRAWSEALFGLAVHGPAPRKEDT